ncbi:hypothetical protein JMK10_00325 [Rhodovulum sulfidophilum]|uniref:hypothetical protein n=1 Tax=Rhodovulum sulfidophilum TaxID=35806 RepID=UPI00192380F2|nr:hypothetical protein [Rhodovulum sulfidophilum]MBL3575584.1 hypothetical protein [Rhodovulum sulfidophilum]MCE8431787.1 hypothetical protein [Rhodovulum sulfidophilum]MCF4115307.1 hypothetical protein [Rhodovulum sulfidophilum]
MEIDIVSAFLTVISAGGGGAFIAFALFKRFGDAWLQAKFNEKLEAYRHDRAKELERLRAEIDGTLRARIRFQDKQFEACLDIWNALKDAQSKLLSSISPLQQYSDIRRMSEEARTEYLSSLDLQKWQVSEILEDADVQRRFNQTMNLIRFNSATKAFSDFDRVTRSYELFLEPKAFSLIRSIADTMHSSLVSKEISIDSEDPTLGRDAWKEYNEKCIPLIKELVAKFQEMLRVN